MTAPDPSTLLAFLVVVVTGGLNAIAVRETVGELAPFWGATLRFFLAGLIMVLIVGIAGRPFPRGRSLIGAMAYGAVGFAAAYAPEVEVGVGEAVRGHGRERVSRSFCSSLR